MKSRTFFNGHKQVPWYVGSWWWVMMVSNWAFYEDDRHRRLRKEAWDTSLFVAYERWTNSLIPDHSPVVSPRPVLEGFKELIGMDGGYDG